MGVFSSGSYAHDSPRFDGPSSPEQVRWLVYDLSLTTRTGDTAGLVASSVVERGLVGVVRVLVSSRKLKPSKAVHKKSPLASIFPGQMIWGHDHQLVNTGLFRVDCVFI